MNATVEQRLMSKIRTLSPQQVAEVEDFVEFLATKARRRRALDRLLAIAPALEAAGAAPMNEDDIAAEVDAVRAERRVREAGVTSKDWGVRIILDTNRDFRVIGTDDRIVAAATARLRLLAEVMPQGVLP